MKSKQIGSNLDSETYRLAEALLSMMRTVQVDRIVPGLDLCAAGSSELQCQPPAVGLAGFNKVFFSMTDDGELRDSRTRTLQPWLPVIKLTLLPLS